MTNIEQKALALAIEVRADDKYRVCKEPTVYFALWEALCRAIEQHEAFRQEVSDAVVETKGGYGKFWEGSTPHRTMSRFIIAKPDPLVDVLADMGLKSKYGYDWGSEFRAALAKRGLEIREKGE